MQLRCSTKGYVGLLVGLAAAVFYFIAGPANTPARGQQGGGRSPRFAPSEKIDVEQAVAYPYDI